MAKVEYKVFNKKEVELKGITEVETASDAYQFVNDLIVKECYEKNCEVGKIQYACFATITLDDGEGLTPFHDQEGFTEHESTEGTRYYTFIYDGDSISVNFSLNSEEVEEMFRSERNEYIKTIISQLNKNAFDCWIVNNISGMLRIWLEDGESDDRNFIPLFLRSTLEQQALLEDEEDPENEGYSEW